MEIPTIVVTKGEAKARINESDLPEWQKNGWLTAADADAKAKADADAKANEEEAAKSKGGASKK